MNRPPDEIRSDVSKAYAEVVTKPSKAGCCGSRPEQTGIATQFAGYKEEDLTSLPQDAVANSFGCGNPVALAEIQTGEVVLDLGSGAGIDLFLAAQKVGPSGRVIGVDMTDEMIAKANENIRRGGYRNVEVRKGLIENLPVESNSIDLVISNCVINLSPEKNKVFREIARVLRPGGRMLISDIVAQDLPSNVREMADLYSSCISGAISEEEYLAGLREQGLVDVQVRQRLVYDADQMEAIAESGLDIAGCCANGRAELTGLSRSMVGKVWSAKVFARKPI